jgi:hypothetical protein
MRVDELQAENVPRYDPRVSSRGRRTALAAVGTAALFLLRDGPAFAAGICTTAPPSRAALQAFGGTDC